MFILLEYIDNKEKQQLERLRLQMHSTYNAMVGGVKLTDVLRFEWDVDSNIESKQKAQIDKNSDEFKKYLAEITKRVNAMPE
jgi:predicted negative regulator of RcsB-dependent stress response